MNEEMRKIIKEIRIFRTIFATKKMIAINKQLNIDAFAHSDRHLPLFWDAGKASSCVNISAYDSALNWIDSRLNTNVSSKVIKKFFLFWPVNDLF